MEVLHFEELSSKVMYSKIKRYYPEIINYFKEYEETPNYLPTKKYMWGILCTKDSIIANKFIF